MRFLFAFLVILFSVTDLSGQKDTLMQKRDTLSGRVYLIQKVDRDGVSMPEVEIKEVTVLARPKYVKRGDYRKYDRLIYNIKRVYPYARMVRIKMNQINEEMNKIPDEKERKNYIKNVEKDVFAEYTDDIQSMNLTQGRLLIKLIDRETQNSSYTLIRDYRGKLAAAFWQGIARIFGTNLKEEYDPYGDDVMIEYIILQIDAGDL
jgi:hypothetical protein